MLFHSFPIYYQLDGMDCGPACLQMITSWYGRKYSLQELREKSHITRRGVNMMGLSLAAEAIGFRSIGIKTTFEELSRKAKLPCIVHWGQRHFIVVYAIKPTSFIKKSRTKVYVADPAHGRITYSKEEFCDQWATILNNNKEKGLALLLEPTPQFYKADIKYPTKRSLKFLLKYLKPYRKLIWQLIFGIILGCFIQLVFPFLTQAIVDSGIEKRDLNFIYIILLAQLALVLGRSSIEFVRRWILLHIGTRINISLISDFLTKLMDLPISFFEKKLVGDLIQRISDHDKIENFLTSALLNIIFAIFNLLIFSVVLCIYNPTIFLLFLIGSLLYGGWIYLFMKKRAELDHKQFNQNAIHQGNLMQLIYGMQEIKLTGSEQQKKWEWANIQSVLFGIKIKSLSVGQWQQGGAIWINEIKNILITVVSATAVIKGSITLGAMLSIQYIIGQLQGPIEQMVQFLHQAQDANLALKRLNEIHNQCNEEESNSEMIQEIPKLCDICFNNISFSYDHSLTNKVINNLSIYIPAGKITAIVGASGSGKTTLIKLLLGFYKPNEGDITLNNVSLNRFNIREWRKCCGVVMQDGFIFNDTVARNIAPIDDIDIDKLNQAATISNVANFVNIMPMKYNTIIGRDGQGLSQGQRQRILIARAVYKQANYLFFDEATNSLDALNENEIMFNLNNYFKGRTVIIIAHRLSTIKNADQIVVINKGEVIESGKHEELITLKGCYYKLIKNQLELEKISS